MKVYIDVFAKIDKDGILLPYAFLWEDGHRYEITQVLRIEKCASRKAGGAGVRYTCRVDGKISHLYYEEDRFFVERR